jgi:outer membrane protein assembly factor BamB
MKKTALLLACGAVVVIAMGAVVINLFPRQHTFTFPAQLAPTQPTALTSVSAETDDSLDDWPQWRGVHRDAIAGSTDLLTQWPEQGPPLLWTATGLGQGMAGVSIAQQSVFTMGLRDGKVRLVSVNAKDGSQRWASEIGGGGEPNGTPTVDGQQVFAITREGKLVCADVASGKIAWSRDFVNDFGGSIPTWGYSESPLVDEGRVICTPGANDAVIVALDRSNGELVWKATLPEAMRNKGHSGAGYSSIVISHAAGVKQYVQMLGCGAVGFAAADGAPLWGYSRVANSTAVIPTPIVHDDYVFVSSGYGAGAALLKVTRTETGVAAEEVYFHGGGEVQNHHGGMVLVDGYVYLGHGQNKGFPLCLDLVSGAVQWGPERGPGAGSAAVAFADGRLYFRYEDAHMALIDATPSGYHLISDFKLPSHLGNSWPHPAIAHRHMFLRDQDVLMCYDLANPSAASGSPGT